MIDESNRWLPPSPHKEAVMDAIRSGRAHVEERGHNTPPLIFFSDGGVMELPRVRVKEDGKSFWQDQTPQSATRQTKHCDICNSLDELKQLLADEPEWAQSQPERLIALLDDVEYMLGRLDKRRDAYELFIERVKAEARKAEAIHCPEYAAAMDEAAQLRKAIEAGPDAVRGKIEQLHARAERFRDVANEAERVIAAHRDVAKEIGNLYKGIRGARNWDD